MLVDAGSNLGAVARIEVSFRVESVTKASFAEKPHSPGLKARDFGL